MNNKVRTLVSALIKARGTDDDVIIGDGHSIYAPERYSNIGISDEYIPVRLHKSDSQHPRTTLTRTDGTQGDIEGVYHLEFLQLVANTIGANQSESSSKMGRGFRAHALCDEIWAAIDAMEC